MTNALRLDCLRSADKMCGEDDADTKLLREMLERAEEYLKSFDWCPTIVGRFFGCGVGGVIAVFLFKLSTKIHGTDDCLWVIEGDVPSAYLVTDDAPVPASALSVYCNLMEDWARAVLERTSLDRVFPVMAPADPKNAEMLLSRTAFIREQVLPKCKCS